MAEAPSADDPAADLAVELVTTTSRVTRVLRRLVGGSETSAAWRMLGLLDEHGALRVTALAELDSLTQPSATSLIRRLESAGYITRTPDPADGRAVLVDLTDAGRTRLAEYRSTAAAALVPALREQTESERETLRQGLLLMDRLAAQHQKGHA